MHRTVTYEDATLEVGPLTYGQRLERSGLFRRFLADLPEDADADARDEQIARANFLVVALQIRKAKGVKYTRPTRGMSDAEFDAAFAAFLEWPDELVTRVIDAVDETSTPNSERATLPPEKLADEERADPN